MRMNLFPRAKNEFVMEMESSRVERVDSVSLRKVMSATSSRKQTNKFDRTSGWIENRKVSKPLW